VTQATRKAFPNTFFPGTASDESAKCADVFDPALRQFRRAVRAGDPVISDPELRRRWHNARRRVTGHVLRAAAESSWPDHLVLRGSLLLKTWFGDDAREPGDIDWVVRPHSMKVNDADGVKLVDDLIRRASSPSPSGVRILADQVRVDDIWMYERAPGRRVVFPWEAPGLPIGIVQCDLVFGERLPVEPVDVTVSDGVGGVVSLRAATPELSLAWKLLWLETDTYPQGKDLYDAALLAERTTLSPELLRRVFANADLDQSLPTTDDFPLHWNVDWEAFRAEYPHVRGEARDWQERLTAALRRSRLQRCQTPTTASSDVAETTMTALPRQPEEVELELLVAALADRSPKAAHAACARLESEFVVPRGRLWTLLATASRSHTRSCVVRLLARGERIDSMTWLLNAFAIGDRPVREQVCKHLTRWGDTWPCVTPERIAAFRMALARASKDLPAELRDRLWAFVDYVDGRPPRVKRRKATQYQAAAATQASKASQLMAPVKAPLMSPLLALAKANARRTRAVRAKADAAPEPPPPPLPGCVVRRRYELPPRRRPPWRWILS
jgi:hypothetical protein